MKTYLIKKFKKIINKIVAEEVKKQIGEIFINEIKSKKFPEIDPPKNDSGQKEMVTLDDFF